MLPVELALQSKAEARYIHKLSLKKELSSLYSLLVTKATRLPPAAQQRTLRDIHSLFSSYESIENNDLLANIKMQAQNKLVIMEMSLPEETKARNITDIQTSKTFHFKDNKVTEGQPEEKFFPEYSNWYGGNVDPQDLRRHKDLLDRQHFSGPFWEDRPRNPSIIDEMNPTYERVEPEPHPPESLRKEKEEDAFESVKR